MVAHSRTALFLNANVSIAVSVRRDCKSRRDNRLEFHNDVQKSNQVKVNNNYKRSGVLKGIFNKLANSEAVSLLGCYHGFLHLWLLLLLLLDCIILARL